MIHRTDRIKLKAGTLLLSIFCAAILLWTAALPFGRTFRLTEINYNEGWNVYNARAVAEHQLLYPTTYGWTANNYPALSFHLVAALGRVTGEYLFTARYLSLAGLCLSGLLAGLIVWHTTHSASAAWLSGLFLVGIFCAVASGYVGMDDPQILAQAFFLAGIYVYLRGNRRGWTLELTALLFVLGGNIKHNLIEFPLAVLLDLLVTSPRRALRFAAGGSLMAALSVLLTRQIDGAAYVSCLLTARSYSADHATKNAIRILIPILLPLVASLLMACRSVKNPSQRVLALLLLCALAVDTSFSGGIGVSVNAYFGSMLATVLLTGVFWAEFPGLPLGRLRAVPQAIVCAIFFLWLAFPMRVIGSDGPKMTFQRSRDGESRFKIEVAYLRQQPGPALCESLLRCYYAGKPYLYDPFNASRFIEQGKLDVNVIVGHLRNGEYGAVQLSEDMERMPEDQALKERFPLPVLQAIHENYRPGLQNEDGTIYLPKGRDN